MKRDMAFLSNIWPLCKQTWKNFYLSFPCEKLGQREENNFVFWCTGCPQHPIKTETKGHRIRPRPFYQGLLVSYFGSGLSEIPCKLSKRRGLFLTLHRSTVAIFCHMASPSFYPSFSYEYKYMFFSLFADIYFIQSYWQ